ncbi:MAG TPA: ABC transporter ATP-binding protein [Burkholderiaceae bacterium]|nr:ABC transporter ATP-binding protein [Burkholderiaceae bacterium]
MALLEIKNVARRFGQTLAVDHVSLAIERGEFFTLLGPSGCGKTTLLRMIAGFDAPDNAREGGRIVLNGEDLTDRPPEHRPVRTVFQSYALFPHMTVAANVAFPLKMARTPSAEIQRKVAEALENVRLDAFAARFPHELSGGQRQRVAIARALVTRPTVMLLDEPLAALDAKLREQMQIELINLQKEVGITFIYVTHDQTEALALSHRIAVMSQGRVEQLDEPSKIYSFPCNRFVADFLGQCNILDGRIGAVDGERVDLELDGIGAVQAAIPSCPAAGTRGALALRPEKVALDRPGVMPRDASNRIAGHVSDFLYSGDVTMYVVELPGGRRIEALRANSAPGRTRFFDVGDPVEVSWTRDAGHFLPE